MELAMVALTTQRPYVNLRGEAANASLADLGFVHAGLDDAWQACGTGVSGSFHAADGRPLVNTTRFPDMAAMVAFGRARGLLPGFYINNCICAENQFRGDAEMEERIFRGTVAALTAWDFAGVKVDSCSEFLNMTRWAALLNATGRPVLTENCHNSDGQDPCPAAAADPSNPRAACPYNMWRVSGDISPSFGSWYHNLQALRPWLAEDAPLSVPGRWAYPDMLEVGNLGSIEEDRAHLAAWAITSSPLVLGHDPSDEAAARRVWDVVSNPELLAVGAAWAGHPGRLVRNWTVRTDGGAGAGGAGESEGQLWAKPVGGGAVAALVLNAAPPSGSALGATSATITLGELGVGVAPGGGATVRDLYARRDVGIVAAGAGVGAVWHTGAVAGRASSLLLFTPGPVRPTPAPPPPPPPPPMQRCDDHCFAAGHCCTGGISGCQAPSCAMGCLFADEITGGVTPGAGAGAGAAALAACVDNCTAARGQCEYALGTARVQMCFDCGSGCDACPAAGECEVGCQLALNGSLAA
eukprot:g4851.t1